MPAVRNTQLEPPAPTRMALLRNRAYVTLWLGQTVSTAGSQISQLAFPLLVLAVTRSAGLAGLVGAARGLPFVILTLPAGALVDRWDRKRVMVICDSGRALAFASVPLAMALNMTSTLQLAFVACVEGCLFSFFNVADTAALPRVVSREYLPLAVSQTQATESGANLVGPTLAGFLYGIGHAVPFLFDAVSYLVSVISLMLVRGDFGPESQPPPLNLRREIAEGLSWLWKQHVMRAMAFLTGTLMTFSFGYPLFLIVRAQSMHATAPVIGLVFASGGIGGIVGALLVAPLLRRFGVGHILIVVAAIWVLTWPPYALAPNIATLAAANIAGWLVVPIFMGTQYSYRLTVIPDQLQGRVNSVFKLLAFGGEPFGLALAGGLIQTFGASTAIWIITVPQAAIVVAAGLYRPLRQAAVLHRHRI